MLLNDGAGRFAIAVGLLPEAQRDLTENWYTWSVFADVNKDHFPDLILGQGNPYLDSHVLLNDGTGRFSQLATALPPAPFAPQQQLVGIEAADISGDGYQDLIISDTRNAYFGRLIQVLINKGDATFRDETATRLPQQDNTDPWLSWIDLLDLDGDGHLDIVAAPIGDRGPLFYHNDGSGAFHPLANVFHIGTDNLFTYTDLDRDGMLDVVWSYPACSDGTCPEVHHVVRALGCP